MSTIRKLTLDRETLKAFVGGQVNGMFETFSGEMCTVCTRGCPDSSNTTTECTSGCKYTVSCGCET